MKHLIIALALLVPSGMADASDDTVYQLQYKNKGGYWIEHKYYIHKWQCRKDVVEMANEEGWKLDRFRSVEAEIN